MMYGCSPEQPVAKVGYQLPGGCTGVQPYEMTCHIYCILDVLQRPAYNFVRMF